jgi:hypothetical protein
MRKIVLFLLSIQPVFAQNLAPNIANYDIAVSLDTEKKTLTGFEKLTWTNTSSVDINELKFHLYLNAFRDKESTFMKESGGKLRGDIFKQNGFGNTYITSLKSNRGEELLGGMKYIQPDDLNKNDRTVISVPLDRPLVAGETIQLELGFKAQLPKIFARTGYGKNDYYLIGQWFPKIGVFEQNSAGLWAWNCHQFHSNSEFYADFGNYKVSITLPDNLIVGATGIHQSKIKLKGGYKTVVFEQNDVHDFAWTASPEFKVYKKTWKGVVMTALMQPEHASQHKRYFDASEKSLVYLEKVMGKYPYKTLTMVDPPLESSGSMGMEYPTFITCGSFWGVGKYYKFAELVTAHELGHQYFQGILASNEFEQSFMDEGFNQYIEGRIMDENYPKGSNVDFLGFKVDDKESSRFSYVTMDFPEISEINKPSWHYPKGVYGDLTYSKTATILFTFENMVGRANMDKVLKSYYQKWKFKHPKLQDFVQVVNSTLGKDYSSFFEQTFEKPYSCDYMVDTLANSENGNSFTLKRIGRLVLPQDVQVNFSDGSTENFSWDAKNTTEVFQYQKEILSVQIDPLKKNLMDLNLLNNSYIAEPSSGSFVAKYTAKAIFWMQHIITAFMYWIG